MAPITASGVLDGSEVDKKENALLEASTVFNEAYNKARCPIEDEEEFLWGNDNKDGYHG